MHSLVLASVIFQYNTQPSQHPNIASHYPVFLKRSRLTLIPRIQLTNLFFFFGQGCSYGSSPSCWSLHGPYLIIFLMFWLTLIRHSSWWFFAKDVLMIHRHYAGACVCLFSLFLFPFFICFNVLLLFLFKKKYKTLVFCFLILGVTLFLSLFLFFIFYLFIFIFWLLFLFLIYLFIYLYTK